MNYQFSIYELGILFHLFVTPEPHEHERNVPPAWQPSIDRLMRLGLVDWRVNKNRVSDSQYELTDRGNAFVELLQHIPPPEKQCEWVVSHDNGEIKL